MRENAERFVIFVLDLRIFRIFFSAVDVVFDRERVAWEKLTKARASAQSGWKRSLRRRGTGRAGKWHEGSSREKQIKENVEKRSERKCDRTRKGQPSDGREVGGIRSKKGEIVRAEEGE